MNVNYFAIAAGVISLAGSFNANAQVPGEAEEEPVPPVIEKMPIPPVIEEPAVPEIAAEPSVPEPASEMEPIVPVPVIEAPAPDPVMEAPAPEPEAEEDAEPEPEPVADVFAPEPEILAPEPEVEVSVPRRSVAPRSSKSVVEPLAPKGVVESPEPEIEMDGPLGYTLSTGYMSKYVFYGADFGDNGIWTGLDYKLFDSPIPIDIGAWYINVTDPNEHGPDDELDLYVSVGGPTVLGFDTNLIYTAFLFPEGDWDNTHELAAGIGRDLFGFADWQTSAHYDFSLEAWYFETALSKEFALTDKVGLAFSSGISYQIDYNEIDGRWNHFFVMGSLPFSVRSNVTLEPYIGYVVTLDALRYIDRNYLHGGVSLSVSF